MPAKAVLPQTHLIHYAPMTQGTWCVLPEMVAFKIPHPWHRLSLKFGIFICDRNSNTCQKNIARTNLQSKTKIKHDYYCSSLYICHTKAMTTLVEYGTKCLCEDANFYSVLIVWSSASSLILKSSHFRKCCEENFYLYVRLMQNRMEIFNYSKTVGMTFRLRG